jgi:hypothetical protein
MFGRCEKDLYFPEKNFGKTKNQKFFERKKEEETIMATQVQGSPFNQLPANVVTTSDATYTLQSPQEGAADNVVVATASTTVFLMPANPQPGEIHYLAAQNAGGNAVSGNGNPIQPSAQFVAGQTSLIVLWTGTEWVGVLGSASFLGDLHVPNIAALTALPTGSLIQGIHVIVDTVDQAFELDKAGTETLDGITIVATDTGVGRWLRLLTAVPKWSHQLTWFVDNAGGNDENAGDSAVVGHPLKTLAEVSRRLQAVDLSVYTINVLSAVPNTDTFQFSPSFTTNGTLSLFNATFNIVGQVTSTGPNTGLVVTAATTTDPTTNSQATVTAVTPGGWATHLGKIIQMTSGALNGLTAVVLKDLGANQARVSNWFNPVALTVTIGSPGVNDTFNILDFTNVDANLQLAGQPTRCFITFKNLSFSALASITMNIEQVICNTCEILFPLSTTTTANVMRFNARTEFQGCTITPPAGAANRPILCFDARLRFNGGGILNADPAVTNTGRMEFVNGPVVQGGRVSAGVFSPGFLSDTAPNSGSLAVFAGAGGLGIFDSAAEGLRVERGGFASADSVLYGQGNATFGVTALNGGALTIRTGLTQRITGGTNNLQLEGVATAFQSWESLAGTAVGANYPALSALATWANLAAAPFNGSAVSYTKGSKIITVAVPN